MIKKQVEGLDDAGIVQVKKGKEGSAWAIFLEEEFQALLKKFSISGLRVSCKKFCLSWRKDFAASTGERDLEKR